VIRILVVDDYPIVREGLVSVLENQADYEVVGTASSAEEGIPLAESAQPDVILLDLELPGISGVDAIPQFLRVVPGVRIIVFTGFDSDERVFGAIRSGAKGYLLKGATPNQEIIRAIRIVYGGGSLLEPNIAAKVLAEMGSPRAASSLLSDREMEILKLVAEGLPNKQIAGALGITERTVKFHLSSIFTKLDAENRAQAVAIAAQRGML
jgi:DNA-binding NarL/FixJ family response regulator